MKNLLTKNLSGLFSIVLIVYTFLGVNACAPAQWEMVTKNNLDQSYQLSWPPEPSPPKLTYQGEIHRFKRIKKSAFDFFTGTNDVGTIIKPVSIAIGPDNRMAIVDSGRQGVHLFFPETKMYKLIFKVGDQLLQSPVCVIFDHRMNLYVSDSVLKKIYIFDYQGNHVKTLDNAGGERFGRPTGMVFQKNKNVLHILDSTKHTIHVFDDTHKYLYSYGRRGEARETLNFPTHIASDQSGKLIINDAMNFRIQIYDPSNKFLRRFGRHGNGSGDFAMPKGVGIDRWGIIYVVDCLFDTIQLFDENGKYLLAVGSKGSHAGQFWLPSGLFIDHLDKLYVCDTYNKRVQIFQLYQYANKES